jgi:L-ascorbate metabolism protein UlaG (beta-lactamase superfamily)
MHLAFQKDETFLPDVRRVLEAGGRGLWWLGQSGFLVAQKGRALVLDPYLSDSLTRKYAATDKPHTRITGRVIDPGMLGRIGVIDVITSSHNHTDHLDAETLLPLLNTNPQAVLVIPAANRDFVLDRLRPVPKGEVGEGICASIPSLIELDEGVSARVGGMEIFGIAAAHPTVERDESGHCRFLGYVVRWSDLTLYHSGDTLWHDNLVAALKPFAIDLALLPINGDRPERRVAGNLDGIQAAQLAKSINARCVIPCHFDLFEFNTASPEAFISECGRLGQKCRVLRNGEGWDLGEL